MRVLRERYKKIHKIRKPTNRTWQWQESGGAWKGVVSPFISPHEQAVEQVLIREQHPIIVLMDNGFRDYYKPSDLLFDASASIIFIRELPLGAALVLPIFRHIMPFFSS